ncbi:hypothetical protein PPTG_18210 [Plasmopara halstedii]|uniref:Protein phosphatase n=1 Tax=Plasmopara halstedii TaxID=4781 RepID=A0A0P1B935_PLAHL|nr:hypothetical protein PPTG_18210 [Plasmopara halstedii]CEG50374.1 hypothetical protein PPTG_18210 [Plasmopara halstedii]|eukprot:XP_024586743.1 hypothetical protein PPTG_18210 [Plasmopara halstedii]
MPLTLPPLPPLPSMQVVIDHPSSQDEEDQLAWISAPNVPIPTHESNFSAYKRRALSLSDLIPRARTSSAPAKALVSALHNVSSRTHQKLATLRSRSDKIIKKSSPTGGWRLPMKVNNPIRGPSPSPVTRQRFKWSEHDQLQHAQATFEYHGEDAGVGSNYFHIVADGVSSPFSRQSLLYSDAIPVSSAILSAEVVNCVQVALKELTNQNKESVTQLAFENAIVDAIKTARINCFQHRKSRLATTLAVSYFNRWMGRLMTFTLGDSKCLIVRQGAVVYETLAVLREFNVPTVVNLKEQVVAKDYVVQTYALQEGDICLTFTDGIGDNVYKDDILAALKVCSAEESALQSVCNELVDMSKMTDAKDNEENFYPHY